MVDENGKAVHGIKLFLKGTGQSDISDEKGVFYIDDAALIKSTSSFMSGQYLHFQVKRPAQNVKVEIFDIKGRKILTALNKIMAEGPYIFNPIGMSARTLSSGVYCATLQIDGIKTAYKFVHLDKISNNSYHETTQGMVNFPKGNKTLDNEDFLVVVRNQVVLQEIPINYGNDLSSLEIVVYLNDLVEEVSLNSEPAGEAILLKAIIARDENGLNKIYEFQTNEEGNYYIAALVNGLKGGRYNVFVDGTAEGRLVLGENGLQSAKVVDLSDDNSDIKVMLDQRQLFLRPSDNYN